MRPVFHRLDERVGAHGFRAFAGYCLSGHAQKEPGTAAGAGPTPRAVIERFAAIQMVDVHLPTSHGRELVLPRHRQPDGDQRLLAAPSSELRLPQQPPPRIRGQMAPLRRQRNDGNLVVPTFRSAPTKNQSLARKSTLSCTSRASAALVPEVVPIALPSRRASRPATATPAGPRRPHCAPAAHAQSCGTRAAPGAASAKPRRGVWRGRARPLRP